MYLLHPRFRESKENTIKLRPLLTADEIDQISEDPEEMVFSPTWNYYHNPTVMYAICPLKVRFWDCCRKKVGHLLRSGSPCTYCGSKKDDTKVYQIKVENQWKYLCYQCFMKIEDKKLTA